MNTQLRALIEAERAHAQQVLEACDAFLRLDGAPVASPTPVKADRPKKVAPASLPRVPAPTAAAPTMVSETKAGRYAAAIVKFLSSFAQAPHHSADSTVLRREVAKACGVNTAKDDKFHGDVSNALSRLKAGGVLERTGTIWALTRKPGSAND